MLIFKNKINLNKFCILHIIIKIINRPGVAGAVLQIPLPLNDKSSERSFTPNL